MQTKLNEEWSLNFSIHNDWLTHWLRQFFGYVQNDAFKELIAKIIN